MMPSLLDPIPAVRDRGAIDRMLGRSVRNEAATTLREGRRRAERSPRERDVAVVRQRDGDVRWLADAFGARRRLEEDDTSQQGCGGVNVELISTLFADGLAQGRVGCHLQARTVDVERFEEDEGEDEGQAHTVEDIPATAPRCARDLHQRIASAPEERKSSALSVV
jgi:hypothetical protein